MSRPVRSHATYCPPRPLPCVRRPLSPPLSPVADALQSPPASPVEPLSPASGSECSDDSMDLRIDDDDEDQPPPQKRQRRNPVVDEPLTDSQPVKPEPEPKEEGPSATAAAPAPELTEPTAADDAAAEADAPDVYAEWEAIFADWPDSPDPPPEPTSDCDEPGVRRRRPHRPVRYWDRRCEMLHLRREELQRRHFDRKYAHLLLSLRDYHREMEPLMEQIAHTQKLANDRTLYDWSGPDSERYSPYWTESD